MRMERRGELCPLIRGTTTATRVVSVARTAEIDGAEADVTTRRRVLELVAADGPVSATQLASHLGLTPTAVRRHIAHLEAIGQVRVHDGSAPHAGRGRPSRFYVTTTAGNDALNQRYAEIAIDALRFLGDAGSDAVRQFAGHRVQGLEARMTPVVDAAGAAPPDRARALAAALDGEGYAASARPVPGSDAVQVCQGHCPVRDVAAVFPELCEAETAAFSRLLGVHVQRLATQAQGAHVCTLHVPAAPAASPGQPTRSTITSAEGR